MEPNIEVPRMFELRSSMNSRENYLRTVEMRFPEWIPCTIVINDATWHRYRERLEEIVARYPAVMGEYSRGIRSFDDFGVRVKGNIYRDEWGCVWHHAQDGLAGQVKFHPLEDWRDLREYKPPDPLRLKGPPQASTPPTETWEEARRRLKEDRRAGRLAYGYLPHGSLFQRIYYLRGFKNFLIDTVTRQERLSSLVSIVLEYNMRLIEWWIGNDVDVIGFGDDLGTQDRLTINPKVFRRVFIPAYTEMFKACKEAGVHVHFHSDGHIMEVAHDLVEAGVSVLNLQDIVNGLERIERELKGRVCIDLDIDRQRLLPFGTPEEIERHIEVSVSRLASRRGGLMLTAGIYPDVPLANIEALIQSMERHRDYRNVPE